MMHSKLAAGSIANGLTLLSADELVAVNGGLLTGGEASATPPAAPPASQGSGVMGMKDNWVASNTNGRWSN